MIFNSDRLHYILGLILFIFVFPFIGIYLVFYCLLNLDNLRWGNIKQNIIEENNNEIILEEIECDKVEVVIIE